MGPGTALSIFVTLWWIVFLGILPLGVTSHAEAGVERGDGGDPGAPVDPKLKRKFITTTWVSALLFVVIWLAFHFHVVSFPALRGE